MKRKFQGRAIDCCPMVDGVNVYPGNCDVAFRKN